MAKLRSDFALIVAVSTAVALACSGSSKSDGSDGFGGFGGTGGTGGGSGGPADSGSTGGTGATLITDGSTASITALAIDPPMAAVEVSNGVPAGPVQFRAVATFDNGTTGDVSATWTFDRPELGTVTPAGGEFNQQGTKGGVGFVTAEASGMTAQAEVAVRQRFEDNPAGIPPADQGAFDMPDTTPSGTLLYPYDKTVFPRGLLPPELMWEGGTAGDTYRVTIRDQYVDLTVWTSADPPSRWEMPVDWWRALTESSDGTQPVQVEIVRRDAAGQAHAAMTQTWTMAPGSLRGTIYYWAVNLGAIVKINPGADAPVPAFDPQQAGMLGSPPPVGGYGGQTPPWDANTAGNRCVACHTVSRDGSTLAASFSAADQGGGRPWGIINNSTEQIQLISDYAPATNIYSALTPDGSRIVYDTSNFEMHMADPQTGAAIPTTLDTFTNVGHPQFSPDGTKLAFVSNTQGGWPIEMTHSDLEIVDFNGTDFSNRRMVQRAATESPPSGAGLEIGFPSFTPDSQWIIYQRGTYSRASFGSAPLSTGFNDLFMTNVSGATTVQLSEASGSGSLDMKDSRRNYSPRVAPVAVGGYFWVVFTSPRTYGNRMASTTDATNDNRKQLWVAAINTNPAAGQDPSHPAFWLTGQDLTTINMDAYWAFEPCRQDGTDCSDGFECCSGFCRDQGDGTFQCVPPPTNECSQVGESCTTAADCCEPGIQCLGGFCALPTPQ